MFLIIFSLLCILPILAIYIIYRFKYKYIIEITSNIPSPPALPIIGHAHYFIGQMPFMHIVTILDIAIEYGNTFKVWLGPELNIIFSDLKDIEVILGTTRFNEKAGEYKTLEPWLQQGLLISRGKKWFQRRKVITPAFHFKILEQFIDIFERESRTLVINLEKQYKIQTDQGINLYDWINLCTLDTICETAMGVPLNAQTNANSDYVNAVKIISMVLHKRMLDLRYRFDFIYNFTQMAQKERKALQVLHGFTEKIIIQRREELLKSQLKHEHKLEDDEIGLKLRMAFLDILLKAEINGKPLSNLDIREEVDTFMFEGHDTTSSAILFFFYNIAMYPECQRKCLEEIYRVMGKDQQTPLTYDSLNQFHYIELCIKETLRLFPSVPILGRKVLEECEINGKIIPAGTNIGIIPLLLGRLEEIFPDPTVFKPERFDVTTSAAKMNPYGYIPFSAGPRNCIGQKFAMLEIKTIVVNVLRSFEIEYCGNRFEEPIVIAELILRPVDVLMFTLKPRVN